MNVSYNAELHNLLFVSFSLNPNLVSSSFCFYNQYSIKAPIILTIKIALLMCLLSNVFQFIPLQLYLVVSTCLDILDFYFLQK